MLQTIALLFPRNLARNQSQTQKFLVFCMNHGIHFNAPDKHHLMILLNWLAKIAYLNDHIFWYCFSTVNYSFHLCTRHTNQLVNLFGEIAPSDFSILLANAGFKKIVRNFWQELSNSYCIKLDTTYFQDNPRDLLLNFKKILHPFKNGAGGCTGKQLKVP